MALTSGQFTLVLIVGIILLARPAHAFGAGNIGSTSKIEGENWRHGDLEDTLLMLMASRAMGGKKFSKLDVKRVYFGNWLRDYSQAVDVGTVKYVSAEAIRILLWILGFMSFGYGTGEFEVTTERLGCYRPEEHIDNPKDYAENEDARQYDRRLRGPVNERRELAVDPELGMKAYIASEGLNITTSAGLVRDLFSRSIQLGRRYARSENKADLYEALRLLGTGCHCLEDFSAHSNYVELALAELGERDVFPHVGRNTEIRLRGANHSVYPIVTGTFGGVDFLHSVTGEFDDKVTQSEIQELEGTLQNAQNSGENPSVLQDLLSKLPSGILGGDDDAAGKMDELQQNTTQHQMQHQQISPREPEEWLRYLTDTQKQIYPILEWHDHLMQGISETIEKIPILPDLLEQVQDQINMFVFSLIAPLVLPIINQVKSELNTGSSTIIQSSENAQHIVFHDDESSDPTHSMLSKDHFSNILNEPAGKVAGATLKWVVPQLIACWDDPNIDVDRTLNRIIRGILHHPALRDRGEDGASDGRRIMFGVVEKWWGEKSEREKDGLREQLSRQGVQSGRNHKPGVHDHGHGSAKKLGMPNMFTAMSSGAPGGIPMNLGGGGGQNNQMTSGISNMASEAVGGGALGSLVGGLAGAVGGGVLGSLTGASNNKETETYGGSSYGNEGSYSQTSTSVSGGRYGQSQHTESEDRYGSRRQETSSYQQHESGSGYQTSVHHQTTTYGGSGSGGYQSESRYESNTTSSYGRRDNEEDNERSSYGRRRGDDDDDRSSHGRRQEEQSSYGRRREEQSNYGSGGYSSRRDDDDSRSGWQRPPQEESRYGGGNDSYGRRDNDESRSSWQRPPQEESRFGGGYGQEQESRYGGSGGGYGRQQESSYGGTGGYGQEERREYGESGGYGGRRERNEYGDDNDNDRGGYTGRDEDNEDEYGSQRRRRGNDEGYGGSGGYGGESRW